MIPTSIEWSESPYTNGWATACLNGFECVRAILLHPEPFTVENDLLTPTFKLKRNDVKKLFIKQIDALYVKTGDVVAGKNVHQK
ncbi:hypothetical protein SDRG_17433 [Saprolegnia diclina VS20]|uniref:Uncharacterized protein n=1 Tax=Saprolegnia diclina (strain VS20) TaxID=1156394 RepID=T0PH31_SAPDV|nr:hypothetical protein SDRG_17432 [Saprolegnia diclina VS20]XP_008621897.1 hypothetical protein SDRG_17433 [Saprolegnia diclina VS20]EQC24674.1 hypothetical protein SDRG_17432 [Saprolegnia diclina VS20]EQC24675.1 hypothetical protein SDRG_17433 [Saprolegnia diclina VS20]|eukprot:XP_008621896.1 hypothetical protein SDRG_17432 [Saprolegnia diclina VS20]